MKYTVVDADGHILEDYAGVWEKYLPGPLKNWPGKPSTWVGEDGSIRFVYEGLAWPSKGYTAPPQGIRHMPESRLKGVFDPYARIRDMDLEGRDIDVIFPTAAIRWWWYERGEHGVAMCRAYNDWLAEYCKPYPERLKGLACLPAYSPEEGAIELERCVCDLGMVGGILPVTSRGSASEERILLDHTSLYPIYEVAQRVEVPICIHPANGPEMPAFRELRRSYYELVMAGFPIQVQIAITSVITGGVMDEFPRLKFGFFEGGSGWVPAWLDAMDEFWKNQYYGATVPRMKRSAWDYAQSPNFYIGCESGEGSLSYAVERLGEDHIMYTSDYGHMESEFPNTVKRLLAQPITELAKRKILGENANRFYKLE